MYLASLCLSLNSLHEKLFKNLNIIWISLIVLQKDQKQEYFFS